MVKTPVYVRSTYQLFTMADENKVVKGPVFLDCSLYDEDCQKITIDGDLIVNDINGSEKLPDVVLGKLTVLEGDCFSLLWLPKKLYSLDLSGMRKIASWAGFDHVCFENKEDVDNFCKIPLPTTDFGSIACLPYLMYPKNPKDVAPYYKDMYQMYMQTSFCGNKFDDEKETYNRCYEKLIKIYPKQTLIGNYGKNIQTKINNILSLVVEQRQVENSLQTGVFAPMKKVLTKKTVFDEVIDINMALALHVLGLSFPTTIKEVKSAYRSLSKHCHPDVVKNNKKAEDFFKQITDSCNYLVKKLEE
ncbi:MAG: J domain-containing protein [Alphaproteobacteria bacterium]|nr:J domain-containing protein [Alphaproteobacteria bacterium]